MNCVHTASGVQHAPRQEPELHVVPLPRNTPTQVDWVAIEHSPMEEQHAPAQGFGVHDVGSPGGMVPVQDGRVVREHAVPVQQANIV